MRAAQTQFTPEEHKQILELEAAFMPLRAELREMMDNEAIEKRGKALRDRHLRKALQKEHKPHWDKPRIHRSRPSDVEFFVDRDNGSGAEERTDWDNERSVVLGGLFEWFWSDRSSSGSPMQTTPQ